MIFFEKERLQITVTYHHCMPCNCFIAGQEPKERYMNACLGSCLRFPVKHSMALAQVASLIHHLIHIQRLVLADWPLARRSTSVCVRKTELADRYCSLARRLVQSAHEIPYISSSVCKQWHHESRHERNADNKTYPTKQTLTSLRTATPTS